MKIVSIPAEMAAIRSICSDYERVSAKILSSTEIETFEYAPAKNAYSHIRKALAQQGELPSWVELCSAPELPETTRKILKNYKQLPISNEKKANGLSTSLDKYRKLRVLFNLNEMLAEQLSGDHVPDTDELIDQTTDALAKARVKATSTSSITHFGKGDNASQVIKNVLTGERAPVIPTGFKGFDDKNGGVPRGALMGIGGFTGLGKTATALQIAINMANIGENVAFVSLEMSREQLTARIQGNLTGQIVRKIMQKDLTPEEHTEAIKAYNKWRRELKENNTRFSMFEPEEDVDIQDVLLTLKPLKPDAIVIDYISLLKGVQGDDQWRKLTEVTRFAKMFAKTTGIAVIILFQTTKEGAISFSKNMANDMDICWVLTGPTEDMDILPIQVTQIKARNMSRHSFNILNDTLSMRSYDDDSNPPGEDDGEDATDDDGGGDLPDMSESPQADYEDEDE